MELKPNISPDKQTGQQANMQELQEKLKNMSPEQLREFQKQQCIFCRIISGKITSKKIYEDPVCLAVLDINPANLGHILLIPKEHYSIMPQIPEEDIKHLFKIAKDLSSVVLKGLKAEGTNIFIANGAAAGQRAQHFMIHIIPRSTDDNVNITIPKKSIPSDILEKMRNTIAKKVAEVYGSQYTDFIEEKKEKTEKEKKQHKKEKETKEEKKTEAEEVTQEKTELFEEKIREAEFEEQKQEPEKVSLEELEKESRETKPESLPKSAKKRQKSKSKQKKEKVQEGATLDDIARVLGGRL